MRPQQSLRDELQFITEFGALLDVMQQVSMSKLRAVEQRVASQASLVEMLSRDFFPLLPAAARRHPLLRGEGEGRLLVVLTSDEGMVGPLHAAVIHQAVSRATRDTRWLLIGARGGRLLGRTAAHRRVIPMPADDAAESALQRISAEVLSQCAREGLREAWLIAPRFLSMMRQDVVAQQLLPLPVVWSAGEAEEGERFIEPSVDRAVEQLASLWLQEVCVETFWSARRAEFAARVHHIEDARQ
ncbi:MAG TPA: FoF1 ATP synthase subunit gamma [archaeon]|nr:FoF1 ATP synthase subunit gamma [archaeon]